AKFSSLYKGEIIQDTAKVISGYADVLVMRHPEKGSAHALAEGSDVPILNGGDGPGEHPTQTMLDLYSILKEKGTLDNLKIGFVGDLKYGRTVHSLANALRFFHPTLYFISPQALAMPDKYKKTLDKAAVNYHETEKLEEYLKEIDVLYVTRIQKERFEDPAEYEKYKHVYVIDKKIISKSKPSISVMHPLPRVGEISTDVDNLPNAIYMQQAWNGVPIRMALLALVTGKITLQDQITSSFMTKKNVLVSIGGDKQKKELLPHIQHLSKIGYNIFATDKTHKFLSENNVSNTLLHKVREPNQIPNIKDFLAQKRFDIIINIPSSAESDQTDGSYIRKQAVSHNIPLITDAQVASFLIQALSEKKIIRSCSPCQISYSIKGESICSRPFNTNCSS
ncbi:MAG TPA: aspartate carbamoyltransferase, partial [Candidatus Wirthbacteria bacterium]|nr:aspartate carbamoyltransferase [Candidatus Wirthbacteria bacterium]